MATLTYREAVARGIAQHLARDERVLLIVENVAIPSVNRIVDTVRTAMR
jgi:pyruvate/2-oxoglutarate/acetoin dehydrogenase E1 component